MEINATLVKELREKTGVGLMACKKALKETNGDIEESIKKLREKGLATASKKSDRTANEGRVFIATSPNSDKVVIVEVNCETDFVASNDDFSTFGNSIATHILDNNIQDLAALESSAVTGKNFPDYVSEYVLKLGEKLNIKQFKTQQAPFGHYIHMNHKIGIIVQFSNKVEEETAKSIAMHIAATNPKYIKSDEVPESELDAERQIIRTQALNEGKPEKILDKIVEGKLSKYYKEHCLLDQAYIKDDKKSIREVLTDQTTVTEFIRYQIGE